MFEDNKIKKIVKKICENNKEILHIYPNGCRSEGYSFIVTRMLYSYVVEDLIKAINEAFPEEKKLGQWRLQHGKSQLPCEGVKEDDYDTCLELRLMWAK